MKTKAFKKTLSICLSLLMALGVLALPAGILPTLTANAASVWDGTWDGSGFSNNHITSAKGFAQFINNAGTGTSYEGQIVYLDVDIDFNNIDFGNISGGKNVYYSRDNFFQGTFDGQGHTIANFRMHNSDHRVGLFRAARNATFKNVTFTNVFVDDNNNNGKSGFAVVVGLGEGNLTFDNVHIASGEVYGYRYVGGIVGEYGSDNTLTITNCSNAARISADNNRAGGLVGHSKGAVYASNCSNTGEIYAANADVGGIVGWIEDDPSSLTNCTNEGSISGSNAVGGILGYFGSDGQDKQMILRDNVNRGNVTATSDRAGGIAGHLETDYNAHEITNNVNYGNITGGDDTGGIIGRNKGFGVWTNNKNYGAVTSNNDNAGGIVGEIEDDKQVFTNCQNAGVIIGKNSTGGIVGWLNNAAEDEFTHCFNTGAITSQSGYAGGIAGRGNKMITCTECFNVGNVQGGNDCGGLVGSIDYHTFFYRCFNAGKVTAPSNKSAGGMIGYSSYNGNGSNASNPQVVDCFNWGTIDAGTVGGIAGYINGGNTNYYVKSSYNAGYLNGTTRWSGVGHGGAIGSDSYRLDSDNGGGSATAISAANLENNNNVQGDFISSNFCKNTWGVRIGDTTYKYPILTWYRDMFSFQFNFVDSATGTNETILKNYGESFNVPNPTRSGYSAGQWLSGNTHRLVRGSTVTAGNTYLTNTNFYKDAGPENTNTVVQSFDEPTEIRSTKTYSLTWNAGAAANMYATSWADEQHNTNDRYRAGIDYTIYNLTTGHDVVYTDNSAADYTTGNSQYFKSYQKDGTGAATATLEVDRSLMSDISETGIYIDYYPFIYTAPGGVRWGIEIFDPNDSSSKGVLNNDHWTATVTGTSGKNYTYEQRFNDVNGNDHRCAETSSDFTQEPAGFATTEFRYGSYKWYFKGAAPDVGDSVTLRITAICASRYNSGNLQILSEWTDLTITGVCHHSNGYTAQTATDDYKATPATCTDKATYYYSCATCGESESDPNHTFEAGQPLGHDMTATPAVPNTCTEDGNTAYWYCSRCGKYFADETGTQQIEAGSWVLPAMNHDWNTPTYDWADDYSSVTATRTCNNGNHPETETRTLGNGITSEVKTPANCSVMGTTTYTATFTNPAFGTQSKDVQDIPTNEDHDYGFDSFVWGADCTTAEAKYVCSRNPAHVKYEAATVTPDVHAATCTADAYTVYTAVYDGHSEDKTVTQEGTKTGHHYAEPAATDWVWIASGETYAVTVPLTCEENDHTFEATAVVGDPTVTPATHTEDGSKVFTATVTVGEQTFTSTRTDVIHAEGHHFEILQWDGEYHWYKCTGCDEIEGKTAHTGGEATCSAKAVCDVCHAEYGEYDLTNHKHTVSVSAVTPDCVTEGFTAGVLCEDCGEYVSGHTSLGFDVSEAGHDYGAWISNNDGTHTKTCSRCEASVENHTVTGNCTGGVATCSDRAVCELCGAPYGEKAPHDYAFSEFVWEADYSAARAKFVCRNNSEHEKYEDAVVTPVEHDATCDADAYTDYTAVYGDYTETKTVTQTGTAGHKLTYVAAVPGVDCQHFGTVEHWVCDACGKVFSDAEAQNLLEDLSDNTYGEHNWQPVVDVEPSCDATGIGHEECAVCHQTRNENTVLPPAGEHSWDDGVWTKRATCLESGTKFFTCTRCGAVKYEDVDALGHDIKVLAAREPTCTDRGITEGTMCRRCNAVLTPQIVISELGHDYGAWETVTPATCTEAGSEQRVCRREGCTEQTQGHAEEREIPATGHMYGEWEITRPATCTEAGEKARKCVNCDETLTVEIPATGHFLGEWTESSAPTCTENGSRSSVCSACGETVSVVVPALGHDYRADEGSTATCTEGGTAVYTCSRCGDSYSEEVAALGHDWGEWETVKAASPTEKGLERRACARCGATEERETEFTGVMDRTVQFVAGIGLDIVVHLGNTDYIVKDQSSKAIGWYASAPLTFEVRRTGRFSADGFVVLVNQQTVAPDADGVYTLPAGSAYAIVSAEPLFNPTPVTPSTSDGVCKLCGKDHGSTFWGRIVAFFHMIVWFFKNLFKF